MRNETKKERSKRLIDNFGFKLLEKYNGIGKIEVPDSMVYIEPWAFVKRAELFRWICGDGPTDPLFRHDMGFTELDQRNAKRLADFDGKNEKGIKYSIYQIEKIAKL